MVGDSYDEQIINKLDRTMKSEKSTGQVKPSTRRAAYEDRYMKRVEEKFGLLPDAHKKNVERRLKAFAASFSQDDSGETANDEMAKDDANVETSTDSDASRPTHRVFEPRALTALVQYAATNDHFKSVINRLRHVTPDLSLAVLQSHWQLSLEGLRSEWPNFSAVIDQIECDLSLTQAMTEDGKEVAITLTPTVLVGPPGCGKSSFLEALSKALNLPLYRRSLETMMTSSELLGSARTYSNSEPGILFNLLTGTGGVPQAYPANFLLACDELDKIGGDERFKPVNMLLSLLETSTNNCIQDACAQIAMDLSKLNIMFTANDLNVDAVSAPLLSRLAVVEIEPMTQSQMHAVTQKLYDDLVRDFKIPTEKVPKLTQASIHALSMSESVREQKAKLRRAMGQALKTHQTEIHIARTECKVARKIGFY